LSLFPAITPELAGPLWREFENFLTNSRGAAILFALSAMAQSSITHKHQEEDTTISKIIRIVRAPGMYGRAATFKRRVAKQPRLPRDQAALRLVLSGGSSPREDHATGRAQ
jgi:hypothetical protein